MEKENELWKEIEGFDGYYLVSSHGRVMSRRNRGGIENLLMKTANDKQGYQLVKLCGREKDTVAKVHRLVAAAFVENPENKPYVNHKNGVKNDNYYLNLEWCTPKENIRHAYDTGLKKPSPTIFGRNKKAA